MTATVAPADRLVTLPAGLPEYTLGYEAIRWATMYLRHPDGPNAGHRWAFTESQARFLLWWYALDQQTGRWLFDHGVRRLAKGAGKARSPASSRWLSSALPSGWPDSTATRPAAA